MLNVFMRSQFKKDYKRMLKQPGCTAAQFQTVLDYLVNEKPLPDQYRDHDLAGNWQGYRECHIRPDWLLIYKIEQKNLTLTLTRTGTHSDLF